MKNVRLLAEVEVVRTPTTPLGGARASQQTFRRSLTERGAPADPMFQLALPQSFFLIGEQHGLGLRLLEPLVPRLDRADFSRLCLAAGCSAASIVGLGLKACQVPKTCATRYPWSICGILCPMRDGVSICDVQEFITEHHLDFGRIGELLGVAREGRREHFQHCYALGRPDPHVFLSKEAYWLQHQECEEPSPRTRQDLKPKRAIYSGPFPVEFPLGTSIFVLVPDLSKVRFG